MKKQAIAIALALLPLAAWAQDMPYKDVALSPEERAADLLSRLTLDEKIHLMMDVSPAIDRLGIPEYNWWNEALHGVGRAGLATVFPQCIGMAATFDDPLVYQAFDAVSTEARAKYNESRRRGSHGRYQGLSFWTPNVNIFRDPRWGRGQETYGEDPYLTSRMGVAVVRGLQGPDSARYVKTLAGAKHYAVHSGPEWNRHTFDARDIDPRDLWETYLPSFQALVDAGVWQVMCAYNRFEGEPCCSNKRLLTQILRNQWGYDRIIVTDCWALSDFHLDYGHLTHASEAEAGADAVASGTDLECGSNFYGLYGALEAGLISEEAIDQAVNRLLVARFKLGEIDDDPTSPWAQIPYSVVDCQQHRQLALDMARKSMVLLKNDGILPLSPDAKCIVMGPNAADSVMQWGNYNGHPSHTVTILEGIRDIAGGDMPYKRACDLVVNHNAESRFGEFTSAAGQGMVARYWNTLRPTGKPAAEDVLTIPAKFTTRGATVYAPDVNLTDFSAIYEGTFVPSEDGLYEFTLNADKRSEVDVCINGERIISDTVTTNVHYFGHIHAYKFEANAGEPYDFKIEFRHGQKENADLSFDLLRISDYDCDPGDADVVIFVGGISPGLEGEEMPVDMPGFRGGDRETIELPALQRDMLRSLRAQGKKVVFVNCSGSAVALAPEDSLCNAILQAWYPGQAGGQAVAEVLYGEYNPGGRLPVTFYRNDAQLPDFQDYSMDGRTYRYMNDAPLYPFGFGLSYTTFAYSDLKATPTADGYRVTVTVTNTGDRDGDEVAQLYAESNEKGLLPRKLVGFRRIHLPVGASAEVTFDLPLSSLHTYNYTTQQLALTPADYHLYCGPSSASLPTSVAITLTR